MIKKAGRPKKAKSAQRVNVLRVRLTASERRIVDKTAKEAHLQTSSWARSIILSEAEKYKKS